MNTHERKRGRPRTGRSPIITLTVSPALAKRIDRSADDRFEGRRDAVRRLLVQGLDAEAVASPPMRSRGRP